MVFHQYLRQVIKPEYNNFLRPDRLFGGIDVTSVEVNFRHSGIYLQLCMWDYYHVFLITTFVFTRLLLHEIYHFIELPFYWLMMQCLFVYLMVWSLIFCYSNLTPETGGFELTSTITLVLQANRLTKCASHPKSLRGS